MRAQDMRAQNWGSRLAIVTGLGFSTLLLLTGCTHFAPQDFKHILGTGTHMGAQKNRLDPDDFYLDSEAQLAIDDLRAPVGAPIGDKEEKVVSAPPILEPLTESQFELATNARDNGIVDPNEIPEPTENRAPKSNEILQELVPNPEVVSLPLRPVDFNADKRRKMGTDVPETLRNELITLKAEPSLLASNPQFREHHLQPIDTFEGSDPEFLLEPDSISPDEFTETRFLPDDEDSAGAPSPPFAASPELGSPEPGSPEGSTTEQIGVVELNESNEPLKDDIAGPDETPMVVEHVEAIRVEFQPLVFEIMQDKLPAIGELAKSAVDKSNDFSLPVPKLAEAAVVDSELVSGGSFTPSDWNASGAPIESGIPVPDSTGMKAKEPQTTPVPQSQDLANATTLAAHPTAIAIDPVESEVKPRFRLANTAFCTSVSGYGQFVTFENTHFKSGQRLLVYCEIEDFTSEESTTDNQTLYCTRLRGSYLIHDESGNVVGRKEFPVVEDVARKRRHDFYVHLPIRLGELPSGSYQLQVIIEDLGGNQTAKLEKQLHFDVN